jgi:hypothetical protein
MEQETKEQHAGRDGIRRDGAVVTPSQGDVESTPPTSEAPRPICVGTAASMPVSYVYTICSIEARYRSLSVEKEAAQVMGRTKTAGQTDSQVFYNLLSKPENRYLVCEMCWVSTIQGLETYIVLPRDLSVSDQLVEAIRPRPNPMNLVIGTLGPIASPEYCNGLMVPTVLADQVYPFTRDELLKAIPRPGKMTEKQFGTVAAEVLDKILHMTDNLGATHDHVAVNFLAMRSPSIYAKAAEEFERDFSLTGVDVQPSPLSSSQRIENVIFTYTNRKNAFTEKFFVRVNTSYKYPFLVTGMLPYFDVP